MWLCPYCSWEMDHASTVWPTLRAWRVTDTAPTVVASLWTVDDEATAMLMGVFDEQLKAGVSKAAALRQRRW
jgi:hypothetical protein